jgi:hypothetical protein
MLAPRRNLSAKAMPPLGQYFSTPRLKGRRAYLRPQTSAIPAPPMFGLTIRFAATRRVRRGCDSRPSSQPVGEGHAPVGAVLLDSTTEAVESIAAPKGHGPRTPRAFSLQTTVCRGPPEGTMITFLDPEPAAAIWWARAMPPLWQYFARLAMSWPFSLPNDDGLAHRPLARPPVEARVRAEAGPSPRWGAAPGQSDRIPKRRGRIRVDPLAVTDEHVFRLKRE